MRSMMACIAAAVAMTIAAGCGSRNFIVYKEGDAFYVAGDCERKKRTLCESGDIDRVVADSGLPDPLRAALTTRTCGPGFDRKALLAILERMTDTQHAALKDAFRRNGYEINKVADS